MPHSLRRVGGGNCAGQQQQQQQQQGYWLSTAGFNNAVHIGLIRRQHQQVALPQPKAAVHDRKQRAAVG
jgi:hypothetical protein